MSNETQTAPVKRRRGQPSGPRLPREEVKDQRTIRVDEKRWNWLLQQPGGASKALLGMIDDAMKHEIQARII